MKHDDKMKIKVLNYDLTVCKVADTGDLKTDSEIFFTGKTDEEISLVCETHSVPANTLERDDGWKAFRIEGVLDFSLIGVLSKISGILAENSIGIFAVSTYNTDYILVKKESLDKALKALSDRGYMVE